MLYIAQYLHNRLFKKDITIRKRSTKIVIVSWLCFMLTMNSSWALSSDAKQSVQLDSDSAVCNSKQNNVICTYTGKAKFNQGTTSLQAQKISVYKIDNKINKIVAIGKHSSYNTTTDNNQQKINAIADSITIDYTKNTMILERDGLLIIDKNKYKGPYIEYKF